MSPMAKNDEIIRIIAESIQNHRNLENRQLTNPRRNLAIGLSNVHYFGENLKIWLTPREDLGGHVIRRDIVRDAVGVQVIGLTTVATDSKEVSKNSKIGELLIKHSQGTFEVQFKCGLLFM